jgi:regulatory protein
MRQNRTPRVVKPLDPPRLEELALAYVARFATSTGKLGQYLKRKLRERGWEAASDPDVPGLIERFAAAGYVDDAGFARGRASSLHRRGYGDRRVEQTLRGAGIADDVRASVQGDEAASRRSALVLARKRGFGPFGAERPDHRPIDPMTRQKQFAAMLRAGHPLDSVRILIDAATQAEALEWVDEAAGESDT